MKANKIFILFFTMLKIGLFSFGGGYAMMALMENEFVEKKKWISKEDFVNMVTIAEGTPGPIAINSATYVGYRIAKFWGSFFATIAVCIPSFVIIYIISLFLDDFLKLTYVQYAFKGIQVCVIYLILKAGFKLLKNMPKTILSYVIFIVTLLAMVICSLLSKSISSIIYILISGLIGIIIFLIDKIKAKEGKKQ